MGMAVSKTTILNVTNRDHILQMSAMYSTTNKWFGLAQMNLEAILADSQVKETCCPGVAAASSNVWTDCDSSVCGPSFSTKITEFWPSGNNIAAKRAEDECVCKLLKDAYIEAI